MQIFNQYVLAPLPIEETIGEVSRLVLTTNVSNEILARYGLGPISEIAKIRARLKDLQLTVEEIELMDFYSLWKTIFPEHMH